MRNPIAWVKFMKNVRRLTFFSNSGNGTSTSPGVTWRLSSKWAISTSWVLRYSSRLKDGNAATSEEALRNCTASFVTSCTSAIDTCRSPLPFMETTMWLISRESGSTMTFVTSPISRSVQWTFDFSCGCMWPSLLFLDRFWRIDRRILERDEPGGQGHDVLLLHQVFVLVGHLALFVLLLEAFSHPTLGIENFLLDVVDGAEISDVVELRPAFFAAFATHLLAVGALLTLRL